MRGHLLILALSALASCAIFLEKRGEGDTCKSGKTIDGKAVIGKVSTQSKDKNTQNEVGITEQWKNVLGDLLDQLEDDASETTFEASKQTDVEKGSCDTLGMAITMDEGLDGGTFTRDEWGQILGNFVVCFRDDEQQPTSITWDVYGADDYFELGVSFNHYKESACT